MPINIYELNRSLIFLFFIYLSGISIITSGNTNKLKQTISTNYTYSTAALHANMQIFIPDSTDHPTDHLVQRLLLENRQILNHCLDINLAIKSVEESLRLMEIYNSIQIREAINTRSGSLRKTIRTRSYISIGAGLISSALLLLNKNGDNNGIRYGGAVLSLSIPIISFISMKKQINAIIPDSEIDYSLLQNNSYPHNQSSLDFFQQLIKLEIFNLRSGIKHIQSRLPAFTRQPVDTSYNQLPLEFVQTAREMSDAFENYYQYLYVKMVDLISNAYFTFPLDAGSREKLSVLSQVLTEKLKYWKTHHSKITDNLNQINLILARKKGN